MTDLAPVLARLDADTDAALARLFELVRVPSISTDPAYTADCARAAAWLAADLGSMGFKARVAPTAGHPMVVAHHDGPGPHVLFYGHYDVQPVDPLALWDRDPFDPVVSTDAKGNRIIVGRGTSDDKGQVMTFLEACRAYKSVHGALPCKVSVLIEGEEESGGGNLPPFLEANRAELTADLALVCDTGMWDRQTPAITTMLRGMFGEEVTIHAASRDLHSGSYGGAAANPLRVLGKIIASFHDADGRVTIPGFYDGVPELPAEVAAQWAGLDFSTADFLGEIGLSEPKGEAGRSLLEQIWSRPTLEVNGMWGGYTGAGFKTVIAAEAHAKISCRLVGAQDPVRLRAALRAHIEAQLPPDCRASFAAHGGSQAITMPLTNPAFAQARAALGAEWGHEAAFIGCGGSIPVVTDFKRRLGMDTLLIGFALEDDRIHSPNEKYDLASFTKGARSWARVLAALAG